MAFPTLTSCRGYGLLMPIQRCEDVMEVAVKNWASWKRSRKRDYMLFGFTIAHFVG